MNLQNAYWISAQHWSEWYTFYLIFFEVILPQCWLLLCNYHTKDLSCWLCADVYKLIDSISLVGYRSEAIGGCICCMLTMLNDITSTVHRIASYNSGLILGLARVRLKISKRYLHITQYCSVSIHNMSVCLYVCQSIDWARRFANYFIIFDYYTTCEIYGKIKFAYLLSGIHPVRRWRICSSYLIIKVLEAQPHAWSCWPRNSIMSCIIS